MPAYVRLALAQFVAANPATLVGQLETSYAHDGYVTQFAQQTRAWAVTVPLLQRELVAVQAQVPAAGEWTVLLEFPLYRLRKRIDAVLLTASTVVVLEIKVGERLFRAEDLRQVEEYALDLRDFHAGSRDRPILPVLWCTEAEGRVPERSTGADQVAPVGRVGRTGLAALLAEVPSAAGGAPIVGEEWDLSAYRPVPSVIEAATTIFAGHDVRSIAQRDASNLREAAARLIELIVAARAGGRRTLLFLTGVPGSGKTLAGLHVVHDAIATGAEQQGDIVYLSGNTPLVTVLREALARDEDRRNRRLPVRKKLSTIRRDVRARIQHINDFLKQALSTPGQPPHEHAIVFDEAQRAWDAEQGQKKFEREASEPSLLLELMDRHSDWCACICLVGGGQEINAGEHGVAGWGDALRRLAPATAAQWSVYAPPDVLRGGSSTGQLSLGELPPAVAVQEDSLLQLSVPMRSFRSPALSEWVALVLEGEAEQAASVAQGLGEYPIRLTRVLDEARRWLRSNSRGQRRYGLVASSGARRLRADGLGVALSATDGIDIAHWYLNPPGDIRSSYALEVAANEYTCQGLELDFVSVCWGGDFVRSPTEGQWIFRRLSGPKWQAVKEGTNRQFIKNSYRVLLTRAREGLVPDQATFCLSGR